jgi:hypothetical protein
MAVHAVKMDKNCFRREVLLDRVEVKGVGLEGEATR